MTMLEKAARAVQADTTGHMRPETAEHVVRIVLAAIQEPDDAVRRAISESIDGHPFSVLANMPIAGTLWQAGVDAILAQARGAK